MSMRAEPNSFRHPNFRWRDSPTHMMHEHERHTDECALKLQTLEFLGSAAYNVAQTLTKLAWYGRWAVVSTSSN